MTHYTHLFWDLDGTLIDSSPGVTGCVRYALEQLGVPVHAEQDLTCFIGPPLLYGFSHFCGLDEADSHRAVSLYREKYSTGGLFECRVYDGIRETLAALHAHGVTNVLATCKPREYAERILAHLGLDSFFAFVSGPELSGLRTEKPEVIAYALAQLHVSAPSCVLMVGDRASDVTGARKNGMEAVGVLWGFGTQQELEDAGAKAVLAAPHDILRYFQQK